jgi:hypothetical protein
MMARYLGISADSEGMDRQGEPRDTIEEVEGCYHLDGYSVEDDLLVYDTETGRAVSYYDWQVHEWSRIEEAGMPLGQRSQTTPTVIDVDSNGRTLRERADLVAEVADTLYANTGTFSGDDLGTDLAYVYPAIIRGTQVEWRESEAQEVAAKYAGEPAAEVAMQCSLLLFRHLFPEGHAVWQYIQVMPPEG